MGAHFWPLKANGRSSFLIISCVCYRKRVFTTDPPLTPGPLRTGEGGGPPLLRKWIPKALPLGGKGIGGLKVSACKFRLISFTARSWV